MTDKSKTLLHSSNLKIKPVLTPKEESIFIRLPFRIYRNDENWTPPILSLEKKRWRKKSNSTLANQPFMRFLAFRGNNAVGRIAANLDPLFIERWENGAGFFGFFECENDPDAANALFNAAENYLVDIGATKSMGPINLTIHDEVGFLTEGFGEHQRILNPYNPYWYSRFIESVGYKPYRQYHAFLWTPDSVPSVAMCRISTSLQKRASYLGLILRSADGNDWRNEAKLLHNLYNICFNHVWGFTPISWPEFLERTESFRQFYRPELVLIAEVKSLPVGFGIVLPDINILLKKIHGKLFPFGWIKIMTNVRKLSSGRFLLLGVHPDFTGKGLAALIATEMADRCRKLNFGNVELSLIDSENNKIIRIIEAAGCNIYKTYTLYYKLLK